MKEKLTYEFEAVFLIYFVAKKKKIKIQTVGYLFHSSFQYLKGGCHSRIREYHAADLKYVRTYPEVLSPKWVPIT